MTAIALWVRSIVLIVLVGWAVETFLPREGLLRYVRLVVGLFVVATVAQPFLSFVSGRALPSLAALTGVTTGPPPATTIDAFAQELGATARALALEVPGVVDARAEVSLSPGTTPAPAAATVEADVRTPTAALQEAIQSRVALGLDLPPSRVTVHLHPAP